MHTKTVVFDEIFHVHRLRALKGSPDHTLFSFMSEFEYTPYVSVPGWPRLEAGMEVIALFREPGNWKTLVGWRDKETGELIGPDLRWYRNRLFTPSVFLVVVMILFGLKGYVLMTSMTPLLAIVLIVWGIATFVSYRAWLRARRDVDFLRQLEKG